LVRIFALALLLKDGMRRTGIETERYLTSAELAGRWRCHPESVRRKLRARKICSVIIGRHRLIPLSEVLRVEEEGFISCQETQVNTNSID
jgi:hypothetical protein